MRRSRLCAGASCPGIIAEVSPEGLQLQPSSEVRVLYKKPGATFTQYKRFAILDCYVEFAKGWERNYNENQVSPDARISADDIARIKNEVSAEFKKVFIEELQTKGHYEVVDFAAPDVLLLRPAIINLMVTAPDLMTPDMSRIVVASAGQMTLYLELWDSTTNTILARVVDPQADQGMGGMGQTADSVTNKAASDTILKHWADLLRKHLDAIRGKAGTS